MAAAAPELSASVSRSPVAEDAKWQLMLQSPMPAGPRVLAASAKLVETLGAVCVPIFGLVWLVIS